jgi:aspartokinase/homoserine dehydrogenase 1
MSIVIESPEHPAASRVPVAPHVLQVGVVGPGKVGSALIGQLLDARPRLLRGFGLDLRLRAVADSRHMWLDCDDAALNGRTRGAQTWRPSNLDQFGTYLRGDGDAPSLLADCSASDAVAGHYPGWLGAGIHVVTPNKRAGSGDWARWQAIHAAARHGHARFHHEGSVGAGLPVVQTLRDLLDTGDELLAIEGMFSGTLAWLFNRYDGSHPFSDLVREAHARGYMEPDPRDDLSGIDVARKLVILGREAGLGIALGDVAVESLVPDVLDGLDSADFLARLPAMDAPMAALHAAAAADGEVLRHVARLDRCGKASVGIRRLPRTHAFAHTRLTDNIVQFSTRRYRDNPLIVQGPGAGPEVTAAAVFTDLLRVASAMGALRCVC